ncbi:Calpain-2 catalytic subunit [Fasciola gigantica]|uniref:Calpain-2 catalytic subunit n=1 Tax=Fasciola gigantica TaxID=46835 RepID=A0A504YRD0_FASGI|nr:Calpain-2 catalytic subunit [Fasciola gigantica]
MFKILKPKCEIKTEGSNAYFNIGFGNLGNVRIGGNAPSMIMPFLGDFKDPRISLRNILSNKVIVPPDYGNNASKPIPSTRGGDLTTTSLSYDELKTKLLKEGRLFEDPDFPATDKSLYFSQRPPRPIEWLRPAEICANPEFITGGASRFDVRQGELGDCWLLAAIACLSMHDKLFAQIVPDDQGFGSGYCGLFRFHFWRFGEWKEVVVDDRLPTVRGSLVYIHSTEKNEFWSALMEKAYAKLCGSYEALKGGTTSEALEDFTGGIAEMFELRSKAPSDLFQVMLQSQERSSLMACSIQADPNRYEAELPNGLIMGHAYSVTSVKLLDISLPGRTGQIPLVRVRNPWGNEAEWKGAWSDKSREWQLITPDVRKQMGLTFDDDGEFWMSFEDFKNNFEKLEICHLGPQSFSAEKHGHHHVWEMCIEHGSWQRRVTAGGCRNYLETFWINPQFRVTVPDPHEGNEGTMIVGLMQKNRRKMRSEGEDLLTIGYAIYELPSDQDGTLGLNFFKYNASKARSPAFINLREVCGRHKLKPGRYVIVPSTFQPNEEADFMLRIFSEQPQKAEEMDEEVGMTDETVKVSDMNEQQSEALRRAFNKVAGVNGEIDSEELRDILNVAFTRDFKFDGFSLESCRSMVSMLDCDRSSMLSFDEFQVLWNQLRVWKTAFKTFDVDKSGTMNSFELRNALKNVGFSVNNVMFSTLVMRFSSRDGTIPFDEYVLCCARLRTLFEMFKGLPKDEKGRASLDENTFVNMVLYM